VVLRFYQNLPFEEVALLLGASLSTAKMRVYRGVERVKESMKKDE
jgi:DNA-directed RNA polymerase specialized sigma24 family protein